LVEVLRQQWGPDIRDVVAHLLARGIRFWLAHISAEIMPQSETPTPFGHRPKGFKADTSSGLGFRPHEYKFDEHDYHAYTTQRDLQLLHTPRGRIALQYGGVMARLARSEVSDDDFFRGFSEDMYDVGDLKSIFCAAVYHIGTGQKKTEGKGKGKQGHGQLGKEEESDPEQTSIVSWWPKPSAWARGSLDGAWWTPQCENDFFLKRLGHFEKGVYLVRRQSDWRHNLKFRKEVKKCWDGYERVADSLVQSLIAFIARQSS
ncbi:hypothetical protein B0H11DRAFT_1938924, partial [Mycena galericulata]